jgi:hypothetical protein
MFLRRRRVSDEEMDDVAEGEESDGGAPAEEVEELEESAIGEDASLQDAWRALGFIAVTSLFAVSLIGVGVWYGRRSSNPTTGPAAPPQLPPAQLGGLNGTSRQETQARALEALDVLLDR